MTTVLALNDGTEEIRAGGNRTWRNMNPGNVEPGTTAADALRIGIVEGFDVFPTREVGVEANAAFLHTKKYMSSTLDAAIASYAPAADHNDVAKYQADVRRRTGIGGGALVSSLTSPQFASVQDAIFAHEGQKTGNVSVHPSKSACGGAK